MILFSEPFQERDCRREQPSAHPDESNKLCWFFGEAVMESEENLKGCFVGPRREMITPGVQTQVEITQNMGLEGISRIE